MSKVGKFLTNIWAEKQVEQRATGVGKITDISEVYENYEPYSLGVYYGEKLKKRDRKSIYTEYKMMMQGKYE